MERRKKIDETLKERHGILHLLERLKKENISIAEMEEIGVKLQKSGKRALPPIVRQLWREKSGDLISKYTYLLDFFDDAVWIDQLIQIAIRRKDLDDEGKEALLDALEEYGVDVNGPPFSLLLARDGASLQATLPKLLDKGEEGLACFVEDVLFYPPETRRNLIRELPRVQDHRIVTLLEILLGVGDREIRAEAVAALGRVREHGAAAILCGVREDADEQVRDAAVRSLRRLSFLGIDAGEPRPVAPSFPYHAAYAGPIDGTGCRTLWVSRHAENDRLSALYLQVHETDGMRAAWGGSAITAEEFGGYLGDTGPDDGMVEVTTDYALALVRDAIHRSGERGIFLPAEFYVWQRRFTPAEVVPEPYIPAFEGFDLNALGASERLIAGSAVLFDEDFFVGWGVAKGRVCDYAEEWIELGKGTGERNPARSREMLLEKFCGELLVPEIERIRRRLFLTADLMQKTGKERLVVERALAAAVSLDAPRFHRRHHPFLRRLALESLDMAREALAEGYDLRLFPDEEDDWE
jgi:hypothetical protein